MFDCRLCTVPTDNPGGVCAFCMDYTPPGDDVPMVASEPQYVDARGDSQQLVVFRSVLVGDDSNLMEPVNEHVERHQMVLAYRRTAPSADYMFGEVRMEWWMSPAARRDGLALYDIGEPQ